MKTWNRLRGVKGRIKSTLKTQEAGTDEKYGDGEVQTLVQMIRRRGLNMDKLVPATRETVRLAEK